MSQSGSFCFGLNPAHDVLGSIWLMMFYLGDYGAKAVSLLSADRVTTSTPSKITHMTHSKDYAVKVHSTYSSRVNTESG